MTLPGITADGSLELFAAVPIGILNVTREGRIQGGNFAAARLLDMPLKDFAGRSLLELAQGDDRVAFAALLREERFDDRELPVRGPTGERRHFVASGRPLPDGSLAIIVRDGSAEMARQRKRLTQEKMASLGRLAAGVAHEFGNIMATLYGYAQLAARDPALKEELVAAVADASQRATIVTNALHAFEHAPSGELEPFELADVIKKVLAAAHSEIERAQVRIERTPTLVRGPVLGQRGPIEEAVLAIVRNAVEACRGQGDRAGDRRERTEPGVVTISLTEEGERAVITVTDNGPGIPDEVRDRIFDPFFTTKGSLGGGQSMSSGTGLGLGLAVAWNRVREHEGEIEFSSDRGRGTTFRLILPKRPEAPVRRDSGPEAVRRSTARRRPRRSILVADPAESSRSLVEAVLKADHWVRAVATGEEALAAYDAPRAYDYVVLDEAFLPAFLAIKARDPASKIVLLTSSSAGSDATRTAAQQAYAVLRKPEQLKDVRELLA